MVSRHTEKHPNEMLGIDADTPKPVLQGDGSAAEAKASSYGKMKCYNQTTGGFVGWLGTYGNNVDLVHDADSAAGVAWSPHNSDMYLRRDSNRYLGLGWNGYATWGLTGGWNDAIIYNSDKSISLKSDPKRKLYGPYKNDWVCWSDGEDNQNILRCELES